MRMKQLTRLGLVLFAVLLAGSGMLLGAGADPAAAQGKEHCGDITSNETWTEASSPHIVRCTVTVKNSTLTVQPGARIVMASGTSLVIGEGSSLQAAGTQEKPILVTGVSDESGSWQQFKFEPGALESEMFRIQLLSGGEGGVPMVEAHSTVLMNVIVFRLAAGVPLAMSANALGPSLNEPGQATVGQQCDLVDFIGNGDEVIEIIGDDAVDVTESQSWFNFCVPYRTEDLITVGGPEQPSLRIGPGTTILFGPEAGMVVGAGAEATGGLETDGTVGEPIVFSGTNMEPGAWGSIELSKWSVANSLMNTRLEYGGRGGEPMLKVIGEDTIALELQLAYAEKYPVAILPRSVDRFVTALSVTDDPVFVENGVDRILVLGDEEELDVPFSSRWIDIGAAYEIEGEVTVSPVGGNAQLTIAAGSRTGDDLRLVFRPGASLVISESAALRVIGTYTLTKPVVFTGAEETPGSWSGLKIGDDAEFADIEYAVFEYGGEGGSAMIEWHDTPGALLRSTLRGAAGYPLSVLLSQASAIMGEEQQEPGMKNTVEDNGMNRFLVYSDRAVTRDLTVWADPGAPVEFDGDVMFASPQTPLLRAQDGLTLLFRAGSSFQLGLNPNSRAALQIVNEDPATPVTLGPADPAEGWGGAKVMQGSTITGEDVVIEGVSDDSSCLSLLGGTAVLSGAEFRGEMRGVGLDLTGSTTSAEITESSVSDNRIGVRTADGAWLAFYRSKVTGNTDWGVYNEDPDTCVAAELIWWGSDKGPNDPSDAEDGCMNAANDSPTGQKVSDDVHWWPYAIDQNYTPSPGVGPSPKMVFLPTLLRGGVLK